MKVYSVRNNLYAIDENLRIIKLSDLPKPYFFIDDFERNIPENAIKTNLKSYPHGFTVWKIEAEHPSEIPYLRNKFDKPYEADVRYIIRLFIDDVLQIADYRDDIIAFFDIETDMHGKVISLYIEKLDGKGEYFNQKDEKKLIREFVEWMMANDVVVLLAWNGFKFDFKIIGKKVKQYLSKEHNLYWDLIEKLDYMFIYDRFVKTERKTLDYVAKANGLEGKIEFEGRVWELDEHMLRKYNIHDVVIMINLERKYELMKLAWELAKLTNLPISEVVDREHNGKIYGNAKTIIDALLLREARLRGVVLPSATEHEPKSFEGAYIWAKRGIYEYVGVFDVNSLYPSIIINEGYSYDILVDLVKQWFERRFYYKRKWKEGDKLAYYKQATYKILINAMYGVMAYPQFRLYNTEYAEKVTAKGREIVMSMKNYVNEVLGYEVVYVDTDSVYILVGSDDEDEYRYIEHKLNEFIKPYTLDWEKTYQKLIIFTRKRYAGITTEGKFDVKGLEIVRGDAFDLLRDMQRDILMHTFEHGWDKEWLSDYMNMMYERLYAGEFDNKLIFVKGVKDSWDEYKANTPQLRAWKKLGDKDILFIEYYWAKNGDVEPIREGKEPEDIDYRYYWNLIVDMVNRIREVFVEQKSIFDFGGE